MEDDLLDGFRSQSHEARLPICIEISVEAGELRYRPVAPPWAVIPVQSDIRRRLGPDRQDRFDLVRRKTPREWSAAAFGEKRDLAPRPRRMERAQETVERPRGRLRSGGRGGWQRIHEKDLGSPRSGRKRPRDRAGSDSVMASVKRKRPFAGRSGRECKVPAKDRMSSEIGIPATSSVRHRRRSPTGPSKKSGSFYRGAARCGENRAVGRPWKTCGQALA